MLCGTCQRFADKGGRVTTVGGGEGNCPNCNQPLPPCTHREDRIHSATGVCGDCGQKVAESVFTPRTPIPVPSALEAPVRAEEWPGQQWRLVIPGAGPGGRDIEFDVGGCSTLSGGHNLARLINVYAGKIISERDQFNVELGKARGTIDDLRLQIATMDDPAAASARDQLRSELLTGLARLNGEAFADVQRLTRALGDARAEIEQAKKVALDEIERRKAAERDAEIGRRATEVLRDAMRGAQALLGERGHYVTIGGTSGEAIGCCEDQSDVVDGGEPDAWFIAVPKEWCPVSSHEEGGAETDSDEGLLKLLQWIAPEIGRSNMTLSEVQSWSRSTRAAVCRAAVYHFLRRYPGSEKLTPRDWPEVRA